MPTMAIKLENEGLQDFAAPALDYPKSTANFCSLCPNFLEAQTSWPNLLQLNVELQGSPRRVVALSFYIMRAIHF
jgi:hypothetical protein